MGIDDVGRPGFQGPRELRMRKEKNGQLNSEVPDRFSENVTTAWDRNTCLGITTVRQVT
jgi:hypothetical protein